MRTTLVLPFFFCACTWSAPLQDAALQSYFAKHAAQLEEKCLPGSMTLESWKSGRDQRREELFEMLSLSPRPEKTALHAVVTGTAEAEGVVVENLHYQSSPGLYVTANFYRPREVSRPLPTILYVCGHSPMKTNGVSLGNKTAYQHHAAWFARNGYTCLVLDTIQLGEIEGIHHGTYREGMWWWNSRGYTPAGVEAWNCIRALDYLETRPEVDKNRFGVTGRSGGGAYSWWIAALDERIKAAAPVAGITDLRNHVSDGAVEGHCDCMYFVNTSGWDYPMVAALVAPRPLLICNTDKDPIFPLDGVLRTHAKVAHLYDLYGASTNLGLLITEGSHVDTQDLQLPVFRWFNRHLRGADPVITMATGNLFAPEKLKVFRDLPRDERASRIHETFVPKADGADWSLAVLRERVFNGWPEQTDDLNIRTNKLGAGRNGDVVEIQFESQPGVPLSLLVTGKDLNTGKIELVVATQDERAKIQSHFLNDDLSPTSRHAVLFVRGTESNPLTRQEIQIRRRYMLLGQTLDGMRVWDILRGVEVLADLQKTSDFEITAHGVNNHARSLMLAAVFDQRITRLQLVEPENIEDTADYLNLFRFASWETIRSTLRERGALR